MATSSDNTAKVVPAQLSFLAIYNPSLGKTDEEFSNQVVCYFSKDANSNVAGNSASHEENQKLRHVGLAQGMVDFASGFTKGASVDSVDTEKTRVVLKQIEKDWWILASVDLTCIPASSSPNPAAKTKGEVPKPAIEYSSREVSPAVLLLQQLSRAHNIFMLHHGPSLSDLFERLGRDRFCNTLDRFWTKFAQRWDVLLHGSPAVEVFGGMKLSAGGELGIGVGEEEWGSGEREVLEDFCRRTDGLVDMVVSRFSGMEETQHDINSKSNSKKKETASVLQAPWMGSGQTPEAPDGVVFSGVGAIARSSLRDISHWMEQIYAYGEYAYGVKDNPSSDRKRRRRRHPQRTTNSNKPSSTPPAAEAPQHSKNLPPGIPRPIVSAAERSLARASNSLDNQGAEHDSEDQSVSSITDPETWKYYLTFGYSSWGPRGQHEIESQTALDPADPSAQVRRAMTSRQPSLQQLDPTPVVDRVEETIKRCIEQENKGHFVVGLKGDIEDEDGEEEPEDAEGWNNRILLRTLHVKLEKQAGSEVSGGDESPTDYEKLVMSAKKAPKTHTRLRVIVYVHRPFIYTFLFKPRAESLAIASFYSSIHSYFSPMHRPLSVSTSPSKVAARLADAADPQAIDPSSNSPNNKAPIFDLVHDPRTFTVHSSLPNIPEPGTFSAEGLAKSTDASTPLWTRVEALNVHSAILDTVSRTRGSLDLLEQTGKTSRGWWVVWMRLPASGPAESPPTDTTPTQDQQKAREHSILREAFLVRRAREVSVTPTKPSAASAARAVSGLWKIGMSSTGEKMGGSSAGWGPKGMAEGIGLDPRKYIETLLSLNR